MNHLPEKTPPAADGLEGPALVSRAFLDGPEPGGHPEDAGEGGENAAAGRGPGR